MLNYVQYILGILQNKLHWIYEKFDNQGTEDSRDAEHRQPLREERGETCHSSRKILFQTVAERFYFK